MEQTKNYIRGMLITLISNNEEREKATEEVYSSIDCDNEMTEPIIKGILLKYNNLNIGNVSKVAIDISKNLKNK
jgi:hypothetical protein